jgi:large subunit ribosomal protein L30
MFNLHPPIKGFEKKGKKAPFSLKGAFGYRGKEINNLLERMI